MGIVRQVTLEDIHLVQKQFFSFQKWDINPRLKMKEKLISIY